MADIPPPPPGAQPGLPQYSPPPMSGNLPPAPPGMPGSAPPPAYQMPGQQAGYPMGRQGMTMTAQFTGPALWSIILGLAGILVPIFFNYVFFLLPIVGLLSAIQAFRTGRVIGGIVGVVLNLIAGAITAIALFVH